MTPPAGAPREVDVRAAMNRLRERYHHTIVDDDRDLSQYRADLALVAQALAERPVADFVVDEGTVRSLENTFTTEAVARLRALHVWIGQRAVQRQLAADVDELVDEIDGLRDLVGKQTAKWAAACSLLEQDEAMLRRLEWSATPDQSFKSLCPVCAAPKDLGHGKACTLSALLRSFNVKRREWERNMRRSIDFFESPLPCGCKILVPEMTALFGVHGVDYCSKHKARVPEDSVAMPRDERDAYARLVVAAGDLLRATIESDDGNTWNTAAVAGLGELNMALRAIAVAKRQRPLARGEAQA